MSNDPYASPSAPSGGQYPGHGPAPGKGGLITFAVLNFVVALFYVIGIFALLAAGAMFGGAAAESGTGGLFAGLLLIMGILMGLMGTLAIVSGIGYIQQKRGMGLVVGTIFCSLSLLFFLLSLGQGFQILNFLFSFVYPLLQLIMIWTALKPAFVR